MQLILPLLTCSLIQERHGDHYHFILYEFMQHKSKYMHAIFFLQARANITEVHFLPFNPVDKRTAITYFDSDGNWYRASKGAPEQVPKIH